tara:strand:- start:260 stop:628 length:369 start_codon:yes stop_codon:yes gene_type:complete
MAKTIKRKVKSKKPLNLNQLKRLCLKKDKNIIKLKELEIIVAQEKDEGTKYKLILDGSALVNGQYISDYLLTGKKQNKGEMVFLNGVSKSEDNDYWEPNGVQVCDGNIISFDCMDGLMVYSK